MARLIATIALIGLLGWSVSASLTLSPQPAAAVCPVKTTFVFGNASEPTLADSLTGAEMGVILEVTYQTNPNCTGWMNLTIDRISSPTTDGCDMACVRRLAGWAEGTLFATSILQTWFNSALPTWNGLDSAAKQWVNTHYQWMKSNIADGGAKAPSAKYGEVVGSILAGMQGLSDGYNTQVGLCASNSPACLSTDSSFPLTQRLSTFDMFFINFMYEAGDVAKATKQTKLPEQLGGCSCMIRFTGSDIIPTHTMWTQYSQMLRVAKSYRLKTTDSSDAILFSSYPATLHSGDDFYVNSNGLVVMETTNLLYNQTLAETDILPQSVSEFLRVMVSNELATDGLSWANTFSHWNSGTYNNQWMVLNTNRVSRDATNGKLQPATGTLMVLEQMPGTIVFGDQTDILLQQGYWASYNIPFYPIIYNISGYRQKYDEYGSYFSYTEYARPRMFARNATQTQTMEDVQRLLRYNEFKTDPLSLVPVANSTPPYSAMLALSSRGDLVPENGNFGVLQALVGAQAFGSIDGKVTSYNLLWPQDAVTPGSPNPAAVTPRAHFQSGPTHETQPVFQWSTYAKESSNPHWGHPDRYDFDWVVVQ